MSPTTDVELDPDVLLQVDDLRVQFDTPDATTHAVDGVSFTLRQGQTLAIVGESGSGKTVTMLALLRLLPEPPGRIVGGRVRFRTDDGVIDLLDRRLLRAHRIRGREVGYVAQDPLSALNPTVTIGTQITESLRHHLRLPARAARERAAHLLDRVGIADATQRLRSYPHELSGGMRQRVIIAIAISCGPRLLIADEPTTALDVTVQAQIIDLVKELRAELGLAVIWITHDLGVVAGVAEQVAVMYAGRLIETAPLTDVFDRPLHPYTKGLLGAVPRIGERRARLESIPGMPPDLRAAPSACSFAPRCANAFERCREEVPAPRVPEPGRTLACFYDLERDRPRDA